MSNLHNWWRQFPSKQEILIKNNLLFHPFPYDLFRLPFTVSVGGVDEVSSELHESVQDFEAGFFVQFGSGPELENRINIFRYLHSAILIDLRKITFKSYVDQVLPSNCAFISP